MNVEGRPQSASGQTTILTGISAPQLLGHHKQGFPNAVLREVIRENSIFLQLKKQTNRAECFRKCLHAAFFRERAATHLPQLAAFLRETLQAVDLETTTVILTSDHGNIEDLSVCTRTLNDVPTIVWGRLKSETAARIKTLADIAPAILHLLN